MAQKQILGPIILPMLISGFLVQALVSLLRIETSYRAMAEGHGAGVIGQIAAVFALLPVLFALSIGRQNDRGRLREIVAAGAAGVTVAAVLLAAIPSGLAVLFASNGILGISQTLLLFGLQVATSRSSSRAHRDVVLGNYMVALSLGQAAGPLMIGLNEWPEMFRVSVAAMAIALFATVLVLVRHLPSRPPVGLRPERSLRAITSTRGLRWLIALGAACVAAQDLLLAYLPVFGQDTGLSSVAVGMLLSLRAIGAIVSRLLYGRASRWLGRMRLTVLSAALGGTGLLALGIPAIPAWAVAMAMSATGFGLGLALTCSVALTIAIAPPDARGAALSIRMTAIRLAQVIIPATAGIAVAFLGSGGTFALSGAVILGAAAARPGGVTLHGGRAA